MKKQLLFYFIIISFLNINAQNNCLNFDGSNDFVAIASNFGLGINNLSVECWVYIPDNSEQGTFIKIGNSTSGYGIGVGGTTFENPGNKLIYLNETKSWRSTGNDIGTGWHHIAFTIDGSNSTIIYLDGISIHSFSEAPVIPSVVTYIGSCDNIGGRLLSGGKIDEVRIWNDVRTETEIRQNMYREISSSGTDLVAYYKLNSTSGTTAIDEKGSNNGTLTNYGGQSGYWQTSPAMFGPRNCLDFDGTGDYVNCGSKNLSGSSITLECWVNVDAFQSSSPFISSLIGSESDGNSAFLRLGDADLANNKVQFDLYFGDTQVKLDGNIELAANTWNHIAGVYSSSSGMKLYINGVLDASNSQSGSFISNTNFFIGTNDGAGRYLDGSIDEVRIWNDARTTSEIQENMCKNINCSESGLTAYYSCDYFTDSKLPDYNSDQNGIVSGNTSKISSSAFNTWLNTSDNDWLIVSNWSKGSVPGLTDNLGIINYEGGSVSPRSMCSGAIYANHFIIGNGASFEPCGDGEAGIVCGGNFINNGIFNANPPAIQLFSQGNQYIGGTSLTSLNAISIISATNKSYLLPEASFTIRTQLSIPSGAAFIIQSSADNTGSLIVSGASSGNVTFKRYVDDIPAKGDPKWHYVSSPVSGQALDNSWMSANTIAQSSGHYQFYRFDEDSDYWIIYDSEGNPEAFTDNTFIEARGYCLTRNGAGELSFTGTVRTDNVTYSATYTSDNGEGCNLVGNPFTCSIGITSSAATDANFLAVNTDLLDNSYEAIYIWDEAADYSFGSQDYKTISNAVVNGRVKLDQNYIQPGQAFMVKVVSPGGNLAFNENMQTHSTDNYYKNSEELWPSVELIVENNNGLTNSTAIGFNENMTFGLDPSFDVGKMKGNPDIALYTKLVEDNGVDFAIQALPSLNAEKVEVSLGLDVTQSGNYSFKLFESENFDETTSVKLEDKETGSLVDFREIEVYPFNINEPSQIRERFVLHFNNATGIEDQSQEIEDIRFYVYYNKLYIIDKKLENGTIQLFNMLGQPVMEKQYSEAVNSFYLSLKTGYYVIRIFTDKNTISGKIYVE